MKKLILFVTLASAAIGQGIPWDNTDLGPFQSGCFKINNQVTAKGVAIAVGTKDAPATILFDTELLRVSAAWTGGFVKFPRGRGGLEGQIGAAGDVQLATGYATGWGAGDDPRDRHQGHLPNADAKWRGLYVNGGKVVLSYTVGATPVLELPGYEVRGDAKVFTRTIEIGKTNAPTALLICDVPNGHGTVTGLTATITGGTPTNVSILGGPAGCALKIAENGRVSLDLPALTAATTTFQIQISSAPLAPDELLKRGPLPNLVALTKGGPAQWGAPIETTGKLGTADEPYVIDEIPLPDDNPFKSWMRPGGHDFFPDGTAALVNISGDVWIVSGIDDKLEHVKWKRFATGLFQPLGCKVVNGEIYVLGRDQITRLHDLNKDGEADWYECFNNDCVVTENYHEFALDLQTDRAGNFYYAKGSPWEPTVQSPHQGTMIRVSKDGSKFEIIATGLRAPNGNGIGPKDELTVSDNQGHWMPANRLNLIKPGGFYGMTPALHREAEFKAADGTLFKANPSEEAARKEFKTNFWGNAQTPTPTQMDAPLCWIPMNIDNSSGGEVWVPEGNRWGPLGGQMLQMSYGKCALFNVVWETVDGVAQGGLVRFPFKFPSGIMRARFSPKDGQLYVSGLNVWQSDAAKFGCFTRVRYTGKTATRPIGLHATKKGVEIVFTAPLDEKSALDKENYSVERWNYRWTGNYGSPDFSIVDPNKQGHDPVEIGGIRISPDKKTINLDLADMGLAMQMKIKFKIASADGKVIEQEIYNTINKLPGEKTVLP